MRRKPKALPLGYVVVAFQADWQMCTTKSTTYNAPSIGVTWLLLWSEWGFRWRLAASVRRKPLAWAQNREWEEREIFEISAMECKKVQRMRRAIGPGRQAEA